MFDRDNIRRPRQDLTNQPSSLSAAGQYQVKRPDHSSAEKHWEQLSYDSGSYRAGYKGAVYQPAAPNNYSGLPQSRSYQNGIHQRGLSSNNGAMYQQPLRTYQGTPQMPVAPARSNMSRSRMSVNTSASQMDIASAEYAQMFTDELRFLIGNQERNIRTLKDRLQHDKAKIENDFSVLKAELNHILEDAKLSVQAQLDVVYKTYITKYAALKGQIQQLRRMRKEILANADAFRNDLPQSSVSNRDIMAQMQQDAHQFMNYKVYGMFTDLQREKMPAINGFVEEIITIGGQAQFYKADDLNDKLKEIKGDFSRLIKSFYESIPAYIELSTTNYVLADDASVIKELDPRRAERAASTPVQERFEIMPDHKSKSIITKVNQSQQVLVGSSDYESISIGKAKQIKTDHSDSILCVRFILDRYILTGSKDKTINVYTIDGSKVATLRGHDAGICCLSTVKIYGGQINLVSGSDYGCSSIMLWDIKSWTLSTKMTHHSAAVTGIVDLQDETHLVTGSFDKKICLINHVTKELVASFSNNKTSVTGIVLASNGQLLVTAGIDSNLVIWTIKRHNQIVIGLEQIRTVTTNALICQLQASILRSQCVIVANRDGCLRLIDIRAGIIEQQLQANQNSIIELVVFERQQRPNHPLLLSCSAKDDYLTLTRTDNGQHQRLSLEHKIGIEFGCGIGPKVIFNEGRLGLMAVANQSNGIKDVVIYEVGLI